MIIDSHAHLTHYQFKQDFRFLRAGDTGYTVVDGTLSDVIGACKTQQVIGSIEPAISFESNALIRDFQPPKGCIFYRAVGVHPTRVHQTKLKNRKLLADYINSETVAIGETGLDYHYPRKEQHRVLQKLWFKCQIKLADKYKLPLILHVRQADGDALTILKKYKSRLHGGVVHCFSGAPEIAEQYLSLGFALGIGGTLLQRNAAAGRLRESVKVAPLEKLIVETDAPFVLPEFPYEGSKKSRRKIRNTSTILPLIVQEIAEIKGIGVETAERVIYGNTIGIFNLPIEESESPHDKNLA